MFKLSIIKEDAHAVLGMTAVEFFFEALKTDAIEPVQEINNESLQKINTMPAEEFGFTAEFKEQFLQMLQRNIGKKCLVLDAWLSGEETEETLKLKSIVKKLNEGKTLEEARHDG